MHANIRRPRENIHEILRRLWWQSRFPMSLDYPRFIGEINKSKALMDSIHNDLTKSENVNNKSD